MSLELKAKDYIQKMGYDSKDCSIWEDSGSLELDIKSTEPCNIGDTIKIKGYLSTFGNIDRENDVVMEGAFDESLQKQVRFPLQRNHQYGTQDQMGTFIAEADKKGLKIEGDIVVTPGNMHEAMLIKSGQLNTLSMGGMFKYGEATNKNGNNMIEKVALFEGSVVSIPANPKATFMLKSLGKPEQVSNEKASQEVQRDFKADLKKLNKLLEE